MASAKPATIAQFTKGRFTFEIENFTDTMNWLVSCISELAAKSGIELEGLQNGTPKIGLKLVAGAGIEITSTPGGSKQIDCTLDPTITVAHTTDSSEVVINDEVSKITFEDVSYPTPTTDVNVQFITTGASDGVLVAARAVYLD